MPAIDPSIPLSAKTPDGMSSLGSFVNTANAMRTYQTGQIQQQRAQVDLEQAQGALDARKAVAQVMADPDMRDPDTGLLDLNKLAPAIQAADPKNYVWHEALRNTAAVNSDMMKLKATAMNLSNDQQAYVGQRVGAVIADPSADRKDLDTTLDDIQKTMPSVKPQLDIIRGHVNSLDAESAGKWRQVATVFRNQAFPLAMQAPQTALVGTGANTVPTQTNALNSPPGPIAGATTIPNEVAPAQRETVVSDVAGNPTIVPRAPQGQIGAPRPMPGSAQPPLISFPPGESPETKAAFEHERQGALQAVSQAPVLHATNRGVLEEIDKVAATGTLGPRMQNIMSAAGVSLPKGWGGASAEEKASAYDMIGKYLERNALTAAQAMGPHTNAGLESQLRAQGTVAYNPTAIKKITKLNDALVTGSEMYQPGLEAAINSSPNQIFAKRQFDAQWAQNFDVRTMQLYNAQKAGDTQEIEDIKKSLGPAGMAEIQRKVKNLQLLATQGHL